MKNMKMVKKIGRVVYALPFLIFGAFHLMQAPSLSSVVPEYFPGPAVFWVYLTGIVFVLAALGILFKKHAKYAGLLLAFQLLVFILTVWLPQLGAEGQQGQLAMVNLLKDSALLGAALFVAGRGSEGCCEKDDCENCQNCGDCQNCKTCQPGMKS